MRKDSKISKLSISKTLMRYGTKLHVTFFYIHVVHQAAYKRRVRTELGILSHLLDERLNRDFITEGSVLYPLQEFLSLFDASFNEFPKTIIPSH